MLLIRKNIPMIRLSLLLSFLVSFPAFAAAPETVDVFVPKTDGFKSIRIPSAVVTNKGAVLAFAEGRAANADQAKNKILLKRSSDGGKTWSKAAVIAQDGDSSMNNPCAVVERDSGQVLLMYQSYPAGIGEWSGKILPGHEGDRIVRNWLITSDDEGFSWSKPRDVTRQTKREKVVTTLASGPGIGIQLRHGKHKGRILIPFNEGPGGLWNIYTVYSDDKGKTWKMGETAPGGLIDDKDKKTSTVNEAQIVELQDGAIRFNVRRWAGKHLRKTSVSRDGGATWSKVEDIPELADPSCMASIFRYTDPSAGGKSRILFSGPQSKKRENGTVLLSYDEGKTWPVKRVLCKGKFAYSCLTALPDGAIGCLYEAEGTSKIVFARFTLDWLTEGRDSLVAIVPHRHIADVVYGRKYGMALTLDVFRPKKDANGAAIILAMSGGWISSPSLLTTHFILREPLRRGYTVFAVYHGSQPKYTVPEIVADMNRAVRFIRLHAKDYGIDPDRIGVTGGSAGGHLSLMLGTAGDRGNPKAKEPIERVSSRVQAVACFFPPTDFLNYGGKGKDGFADDSILTLINIRPAVDIREFDPKTHRLERVADKEKIAAMLRRISPITHVSSDDAPTLIVHGDADRLVPLQQAEIFIARLKEVGVPAELIVKKKVGHTFLGMEADYIRMIDWFDRYLRPQKKE